VFVHGRTLFGGAYDDEDLKGPAYRPCVWRVNPLSWRGCCVGPSEFTGPLWSFRRSG